MTKQSIQVDELCKDGGVEQKCFPVHGFTDNVMSGFRLIRFRSDKESSNTYVTLLGKYEDNKIPLVKKIIQNSYGVYVGFMVIF